MNQRKGGDAYLYSVFHFLLEQGEWAGEQKSETELKLCFPFSAI